MHSAPRIIRLGVATAIAAAIWLIDLVFIMDARSTSESAVISALTLLAAAASTWLFGILLEREDGGPFGGGGNAALRAQVDVTRALREASTSTASPGVAGVATRGDLFAILAERDRPLTLAQLDGALVQLERAGVVTSDFDDDAAERVYRLTVRRGRLAPSRDA